MQQGGKESLKYDPPGIEPSSPIISEMQSGHQTIYAMHHLYPERLTKLHLLAIPELWWKKHSEKKNSQEFEPGTSEFGTLHSNRSAKGAARARTVHFLVLLHVTSLPLHHLAKQCSRSRVRGQVRPLFLYTICSRRVQLIGVTSPIFCLFFHA